jgi:hypothetical protein
VRQTSKIAALTLPVIVGCGAPDARATTEARLEYKLAVVHTGGYVNEDDPIVQRFAGALDRLEAKCPESRQQLADMGVKGRALLRDKGLDESLLAVLENWRAAIPEETQDGQLGPCGDILALYITLRSG